MRHDADARIILVDKAKLIEQIKANKVQHKKEYDEAVIAYREEAKKQLEDRLVQLATGDLKLKVVSLTSPVDNSEEYDKLVKMFKWEIKDQVELSQGEFNEYIFDETPFAKMSRASNTFYKNS